MRVIQSEQIWRFVRAIMTLLKIFPQTRYPAQMLLDLVIDPLQSMLNGVINYLPSLFFLITLFLGVLLSLGSTSVISNLIAGYTMTYRRAFRIGDCVRIGETIGDILDSRLLVTHASAPADHFVCLSENR